MDPVFPQNQCPGDCRPVSMWVALGGFKPDLATDTDLGIKDKEYSPLSMDCLLSDEHDGESKLQLNIA